MKKRQRATAILFGAFALAPGATIAACVLPAPDTDSHPSPHSLVGMIDRVDSASMVILPARGHAVRVRLSGTTQIFTAYGGGIDRGELAQGQYAYIWFESCRAPRQGAPLAAVVRVCELSNARC